jgi:hypothetical protein
VSISCTQVQVDQLLQLSHGEHRGVLVVAAGVIIDGGLGHELVCYSQRAHDVAKGVLLFLERLSEFHHLLIGSRLSERQRTRATVELM